MDPKFRVSSANPLTNRALLFLGLLGIVLGTVTFAIDPLNFIHPALAIAGLAWMAAAAVFVSAFKPLQDQPRLAHALEVLSLFIFAGLLTTSTGATSSPFLSFYSLPIIASALVWKMWQVLLLIATITVVALVQSSLLDVMNDMYFMTSAAIVLNALAPAIAAALILCSLNGRIGATELRVMELTAKDAMTGLLNLQAFDKLVEQYHLESARSGQAYSILILGIDGLRQMNESLGHDAGSQMIVAVAKAIVRSIRASDQAARMGGDVFVVLLAAADQTTANAIAQRIRNNVYNGTLLVENRLMRATASIGLAVYPRDEQTPKALMILADQRMEQDKALRRPPGR